MKKLILHVLCTSLVILCTATHHAIANPIGSHESGKYVIHYSVFNSLFVPSQIAQVHQLPRAKNKALVNISVHLREDNSSVPATLSGTVKNLMQQQSALSFQEIKEQNYQYYLATVKHTNEEMMHFTVSVIPADATAPITVKFSQKLYIEK